MHLHFLFLLPVITLSISPHVATASLPNVLTQGSSLFVETKDHLVSPNRLFTAGFHKIGENAYCFGVWFSEPMLDGNHTLVWMANRDEPVNGKRSKFSLRKTGNLVLRDASRRIWSTDTKSSSRLQLQLLDSGNLVLAQLDSILSNNSGYKQSYLWQSFNFPTDTILPNQPFTKDTILISSRSLNNLSSGFYKLYFDNDNIIRLLYNRDEVTSVYWPSSWLVSWAASRSSYNNSRFALLDSNGHFRSTDDLSFSTSDYGNTLQRRLTLDVDGNIRVYTLKKRSWIVSWQAISTTCKIHGICRPNSICTYTFDSGRRCSCMHGYKAKNHSDFSLGCEPKFDLDGNREKYEFIKLRHVEFYGFDSGYISNSTLKQCKKTCLNDSNCKAFQFTFDKGMGTFQCYVKILLFNGYYKGTHFNTYLKLPKTDVLSYNELYAANESKLDCRSSIIELRRTYEKKEWKWVPKVHVVV